MKYLFLVLIFIFFLRPLGGDGDFFHHLNTGRYVVTHLSLPYTDQFTHTANGQPWVGYAWGAGVIFYIIYSLFGALGINLLISSIAVLIITLLYKTLKNYGVSTKTALISLGFLAVCISIRFPARPEIFTYLFITLLLFINSIKDNPKLKLLYPLIILFWANTYGASALLGIILLAFFALTRKPQSKTLYLTSLISIPLAFLNGYGEKSVFYILSIPRISHTQSEWGSFLKNLNATPEYLIYLQYHLLIYLIFLFVFILVGIFSRKFLFKKPLFLILALSIILPIFTFRQAPLAMILSIPFLALSLGNLQKPKKILYSLIILLTLISGLISLWINNLGTGISTDPYSPKLIEFIKNNNLSGKSLNNQQMGAFLTYHSYPNILVYSDTRDDLYLGTQILEDFYSAMSNGETVSLAKKYNIDIVVGDLADGPFYQSFFYSPNWSVVYLQDHYFIALPKAVAQQKKLTALQALDPYSSSQSKLSQEEEALKFYMNQEENKMRLASVQIKLGQYDDAIQTLSQISLPWNPKSTLFAIERDYLLAQIYLAQNDCKNTKFYLERALKETKNKLIFSPGKVLPSDIDNGYKLYYSICR